MRLRETPISTGRPKALFSRPVAFSACRFCARDLPKPMPGSISTRERATPARSASVSECSKKRSMSSTMSISRSTVSRLCMMTSPAPVSATVSAIAGSRCNPQTSLTTLTPSANAPRGLRLVGVDRERQRDLFDERAERRRPAAAIPHRRQWAVWPGRVDSGADVENVGAARPAASAPAPAPPPRLRSGRRPRTSPASG